MKQVLKLYQEQEPLFRPFDTSKPHDEQFYKYVYVSGRRLERKELVEFLQGELEE